MTLEHLVVYGGIVVGIWLIGIVASLARARKHRSALHLDMRHGAPRTRHAPERRSWAGRLGHALGYR
jgi:hypothetical protein